MTKFLEVTTSTGQVLSLPMPNGYRADPLPTEFPDGSKGFHIALVLDYGAVKVREHEVLDASIERATKFRNAG